MKAWDSWPETTVVGLAARGTTPAAARGSAALRPVEATDLATNAPPVGAFFLGNVPYHSNSKLRNNLDSMLAAARPMHNDNLVPRVENPRAPLFDLWKGQLGGDEPQVVGRNFGTSPMGPQSYPTTLDDGASPDRDQEPGEKTPQAGRTEPRRPDGGDDCRSIRPLMAGYVARALSPPDEARLVDHVRTCDECFAAIRTLRVKINVAAAEARERLRRR
jgi:putative zinc finger protein